MAPKPKAKTKEKPEADRLQNDAAAAPEEQQVEESTPEEVNESRLQPKDVEEAPVEVEDYLRQYQYRQNTTPGSPQSDPVPGSKAEAMKKNLLAQRKVMIMVPRGMKESPKVKATVNLNGYRLDFPKNSYLDMPEQVAQVVRESLNQTEAALNNSLVIGNSDKETALL